MTLTRAAGAAVDLGQAVIIRIEWHIFDCTLK